MLNCKTFSERNSPISQKKLILEKDWDYLIILDACRFDFFKELYEQLAEGELRKTLSPGSSTSEWAKKVFTEYHDDIIYVSGNPRINSKGKVKGFNAKKYFHEIVDVWDKGWSQKIGTVPPKNVTDFALKTISRKSNLKKRFIIHFMQPHEPYITQKGNEDKSKNSNSFLKSKILSREFRIKIGRFIRDRLNSDLFRLLYKLFQPKFSNSVRMKQAKQKGVKTLRILYGKNLQIVLSSVVKLIDKISGKVIITADHGELLGGNGEFGHPPNRTISTLIKVPWFEIKK